MMRAGGTVYLGKTAPLATTAADGTFVLTLLTFDRVATHQVEPWRITYTGLNAALFWGVYKAELTPGQPLHVELERLRTFTNGRGGAPETHAHVARIALAPRAHEAPAQHTQAAAAQAA